MNTVFLTMAQLGAYKLQSVKDLMYMNRMNPGPCYTVRSRRTVHTYIFLIPLLLTGFIVSEMEMKENKKHLQYCHHFPRV